MLPKILKNFNVFVEGFMNFEEIFFRMKEELVSRDASFTGLVESDLAIKILEVAAWRELLLRQRMNEAVKSNLLKFAKGEDLDNLAEFYGVEREKKKKRMKDLERG